MQDSNFLWIIKFNPDDQDEADLYIPAPPSQKGEWLNVADFQDIDEEALDSLLHIQEICEQIKQDSGQKDPDTVAEADEYLKKVRDAGNQLTDLDQLFKKFNGFLKRLNRPPPPNFPKGDTSL